MFDLIFLATLKELDNACPGRLDITPASYSGDPGFKSRP
jgi:hypothetical protein